MMYNIHDNDYQYRGSEKDAQKANRGKVVA